LSIDSPAIAADIGGMSEIAKLMDFEEFRTSCDASTGMFAQAALQQREHFRDSAAAEEVLKPGALGMRGWAEWPS
jgi:hypothetical protein